MGTLIVLAVLAAYLVAGGMFGRSWYKGEVRAALLEEVAGNAEIDFSPSKIAFAMAVAAGVALIWPLYLIWRSGRQVVSKEVARIEAARAELGARNQQL